MPVVKGKHYPYTPEGKAQAKEAAAPKYGAATQFGDTGGGTGGGGGFDISQITSMMGGGGGKKEESKPKGEPVYNYRTGETETMAAFKSPSAFKLKSGNTTPFKLMGSSPAKIFGGMFGGRGRGRGGMGGMFGGVFERIRAQREARRNMQAGVTPTAPGEGGGGDGAHTHGAGGEVVQATAALNPMAGGAAAGAEEEMPVGA